MAAVSAAGPSLSVVVPATDAPPTLGRSRDALAAQLRPNLGDELIVVEACELPGPAAARNDGARRARGEVLVFVDADVVVHPGALERIRAAFASAPAPQALFGAYDDRPEAPGTVSRFRNLLHHHVHSEAAGEVASFWAGLGAIDAATFARHGGFDAGAYPRPSIEDIELGARIAAAGGRIVCDPLVQGTHLKRWTLRSMLCTDLLLRGAPWVELLVRSRSSAGQLNLGWRHRLSALAALAAAVALARCRPGAAVVALAALPGLNLSLYSLLRRRLGPARLPAALGAHVLHHLAAVASVPLGIARAAQRRSKTPSA